MIIRSFLPLFLFFQIFFFTSFVFAQEQNELAPQPLPEPSAKQKVILLRKNVSAFRSFLLAPIASWIEADLFRARLFKRLDFTWSYPNIDSGAEGEKSSFIDLSDERKDPEKDPELLAAKIIQNMFLAMSYTQNLAIEGQVSWVGTQRALRQAKIFLFRSYSKNVIHNFYSSAVEPSQKDDVKLEAVFLELFSFREPAAIAGFATSSLRMSGEIEDRITHYSPVIDASRELLAANKGDGILDGLLSADDLFVYSRKSEAVNARVVGEKTLFLPFSSLQASAYSESNADGLFSNSGQIIEKQKLQDGTPVSVLWNADIFAFAQHAPWLPLTMYLVPRETWIIEIFQKDPFYPSGKQVLVVDKESMLPFYKIVHDTYGEVQKTVAGAWSYIKDKDSVSVYPSFIFSVDRGARRATTFRSSKVFKLSDKQAIENEILKDSFLSLGVSAAKEASQQLKEPVDKSPQ